MAVASTNEIKLQSIKWEMDKVAFGHCLLETE